MPGKEVSQIDIDDGRKYTAKLVVAAPAISNIIGIPYLIEKLNTHHTVEQFVGVGIIAIGASIASGIGYLYWDGDGDLSPHRDRLRHFNQPVELPQTDTISQ